MTRPEKTTEAPYVMRVVDFARAGMPCPFKGQYLKRFMPAEPVKGEFTNKPDEAMHFKSSGEAWQLWMTAIGTRPDGKPDRPLTALTVEILPLSKTDEEPIA